MVGIGNIKGGEQGAGVQPPPSRKTEVNSRSASRLHVMQRPTIGDPSQRLPRVKAVQLSKDRHSWFFSAVLVVYPFLILFAPAIDMGPFFARPHELLTLALAPIILLDFGKPSARRNQSCAQVVFSYFLIATLFAWGLIWSGDVRNVTSSYVRTLLLPVYLIALALVISGAAWRSRFQSSVVPLVILLLATSLAGAVGLYAMRDPGLATLLTRTFMPDLEFDRFTESTFNMSIRAMSVFYGYDQASVTYALMACVGTALLLFTRRRPRSLVGLGALVLLLVVSILSSARTGLVVFLISLFWLAVARDVVSTARRLVPASIILALAIFLALIPTLLYQNRTIARFEDLSNALRNSTAPSVFDRSEAISGMLDTQLFTKDLPSGDEVLLGKGDNGQPVSDIAWVAFFIKYGLIGVVVMIVALGLLVNSARKASAHARQAGLFVQARIASVVLPVLVMQISVAAFKGPFYFLTLKTGDLFAIVVGLVISEAAVAEMKKPVFEKRQRMGVRV